MAALLEVSGLSKSFGGVRAVNDVSFEVRPGELMALIGPNGAGKSTCFNMLNGQLRPDRGDVRLEGRSLIGLKPREVWRLGVGRTFQLTVVAVTPLQGAVDEDRDGVHKRVVLSGERMVAPAMAGFRASSHSCW